MSKTQQRKTFNRYLLSQAHMWPQGWNNTAAFLSEQTTHSSICGASMTWANKKLGNIMRNEDSYVKTLRFE